jgi:S1-C subfamily serine protease
MRTNSHRVLMLLIAGTAVMSLTASAGGQTAPAAAVQKPAATTQTTVTSQATTPATPEKQPRRPPKRTAPLPATVTVVADQARVAPQVVTIVHRLSGVKMLRFLLRQGEEPGAIYTIDTEAMANDAHASIIAGWALADGKTIAVRLPQAGAELEFAEFPALRAELKAQSAAGVAGTGLLRLPPMTEPDLTVITRDGRKLRARYIGLDGETGLSVLQVNGVVLPAAAEELAKELTKGQGVQIFAPERTRPEGEAASRNIYVKVGEVNTRIATLTSIAGKLQRLTVHGANLSSLVIGGVAVDEAGKTLGIVDSIEGNDARIVPADTIRAATKRVLERQASVPRPLLGVIGEPVGVAARASFLAHGWSNDQFDELLQKHRGILLTAVRPGTPAALAKLHPGDVIVRVNQNDIEDGEAFSRILGEAGSGQMVQFLVSRPSSPAPFPLDVKLGGSFDPVFKYRFEWSPMTPKLNGLEGLGVETIALSPKNLTQLGAGNGVLVVAVEPESIAAHSGLREGDVIESIDGRVLGRGLWTSGIEFNRQKKHVLSLVRKREKKQVILEPEK